MANFWSLWKMADTTISIYGTMKDGILSKTMASHTLYWHYHDSEWQQYHFNGLEKLNPDVPVSHISMYEAYAFANWKGMRLPTEFEWEVAADKLAWGQLWEWTHSAYLPYPGFTRPRELSGNTTGSLCSTKWC